MLRCGDWCVLKMDHRSSPLGDPVRSYENSSANHATETQAVPICPTCNKAVSIFHRDIFRCACTACTGCDPNALEDLLDEPCSRCGGNATFATTAPALAYVRTKNGVAPTKAASGLFIIGCSDCGHAWFRFNRAGAGALVGAPGWIGREQLGKPQGDQTFECPTCGQLIDLNTRSGIRISDSTPWQVYCDKCNSLIVEDAS
jgi:hypothetical protein